MRLRTTIEKTVRINASPDRVWQVFTDPAVTRQMGGEYKTTWKEGSAFGWKGNDGKQYTWGKIMEIDPGKLLKHSLFDPANKNTVIAIITYQFYDEVGQTTLHAIEELTHHLSQEEYQEISEGWNGALQALKETAESL